MIYRQEHMKESKINIKAKQNLICIGLLKDKKIIMIDLSRTNKLRRTFQIEHRNFNEKIVKNLSQIVKL